MPKEIPPSSFECDCGHQSHFFENTVREAKEMSQRKTVRLGDDDEKHVIVFEQGKMADIVCLPQRHTSPRTLEGFAAAFRHYKSIAKRSPARQPQKIQRITRP
jgi:hypothetical protein